MAQASATALGSAIVGREEELSRLRAFVSGREGPRALVLHGGPGIGKTTLWEAGLETALELGLHVLRARPSEAEARLGLAALADLLEPVEDEVFSTLPPAQRHALEAALLRSSARARAPEPRAIAAAFLGVLRALAARGHVVVAVDDVQWLDPLSAEVLAFAARRLSDERVSFLLTQRAESSSPIVRALEELTPVRMELGGLSLGATRRLLVERLGTSLPRTVLRRVLAATGGNPLFALELVRALGDAEVPDPRDPLPVPASLSELVSERVAGLPREGRASLLAAAALSRPTVELVERASSARGLAAAEEAGLLRADSQHVRFSHPLYAFAVYSDAGAVRRRRLHERLAGLVDDPEERALHLALAARGPDGEVAAALERAADLARARGAWETAAQHLELARELTPPELQEEARRRGLRAAEHHMHAGDRGRARALLEPILAEVPSGRLRGEALLLLGEISFNDESLSEAERLYGEALEHVEDARLVAEIECALTYLHANLLDFEGAPLHADRALAAAEESGDGAAVANALSVCAIVDFQCGRGVDWRKVERALALEDRTRAVPLQWWPSTIAACLLLYSDRLAEARERFLEVRAAAAELGDESDLAFVLTWLSWLETRSGDFGAAAAFADEALAFAELTGSVSQYAHARAQRAYVDAHLGNAVEARQGCSEAAEALDRAGFVVPALWIAASLGLLELSRGDAEAAWAACEGPTIALEQRGIATPGPAFFLPSALEALVAVGQLERAEALVDELERCGRRLDDAWALATAGRCRALCLAARGDLAGALAQAEAALVAHEGLPMPFERARTLLVAGHLARRARRRAQARALLEEATAELERMGARLWAERARAELARVSGRRGSADALTPSERRVAELAAEGLSNKEIAQTLFVSVHTVERHLTHAYAKLGIRSRAQLASRLAAAE